jgi:pimeloyl-ACP methyl ester carboxylesterase
LQRFAWIKPKIICRSCINIIPQELGLVGAARPGIYDPDVIEWVATLAAGCCTLLKAADVPGPYVLVAHSFSGTIARVFAGEHPDEVKGIVFVDVLTPELRAQMTPEEWKIWKRVSARPAAAVAAYPDLERQDYDETLDQTAAAVPLRPMPVVVLTASDKFIDIVPKLIRGGECGVRP